MTKLVVVTDVVFTEHKYEIAVGNGALSRANDLAAVRVLYIGITRPAETKLYCSVEQH